MKTTYFTTFQLGDNNQVSFDAYDKLYEMIRKWLEKPQRGFKLPKDKNFLKENIEHEANGHKLTTRYDSNTIHGRYFALKYDHPDSTDENVLWSTEIVVGDKIRDSDKSPRFAIRIFYGGDTLYFKPVFRSNSRPSIVRDIIDKVGAFETLPLKNEHIRLPNRDIETFIHILTEETRYLPIIFISKEADNGVEKVDLNKIASLCSGMAFIIVADENDVTWKLNSYLGKTLNCFDGGVRVYWPKFKVSDNPYLHPLWRKEKIDIINSRKGSFEQYIFNRLCEYASSRFVHESLTWSGAYRIFRKKEIEQLKETSSKDEWIEVLESDNTELESKLNSVKNENDDLREKKFRLENQVEQLKSQLSDKGIESIEKEELSHFESVRELLNHIDNEYADFITFANNYKINESYEDIESLQKALKWLALIYRKSRMGEQEITNFNHSCKEQCGFFYAGGQSEVTMGQFKEEYECYYKGQSYKLKEHIGQGSHKDPRYSIRIAFFFDEDEQKVVIGYMGQHQRTKAT